MKKFYTFLFIALMMLLPSVVLADSVNEQQALAKAMQFFSKGTQTRTAPQFELIWDGEEVATRATAEPAFFIFNRTDMPGFVIIAGDDSVSPVIGYSFENGFGKGEMPSNLRYWLEGVRGMILQARAAGVTIQATETPRAGTPVVELATAKWDQGVPYNLECPMVNNGTQQGLTGCVQTAAAILCKYNRWPDYAVGTAPGYATATEGFFVPGRTFGNIYDYDLMPDQYVNYTSEQAAAVARLMADLGVMNGADYSTQATGAYTTDLYATMVTYMRYSKQALLAYREGYNDAEWIALLRKELDAGRPILYSGSGSAGGHAFICDGYDSDNLFRFNWGWSGSADGFYHVSSLVPGSYSFVDGQDAIVDLVPDPESASKSRDLLYTGIAGTTDGSRYYGMASSTSNYAVNSPFMITMPMFNFSIIPYNGQVAIAHFDKEGVLRDEISQRQSLANLGVGYGLLMSLNCTIKQPIERGDYIMAVYLENSTQTLAPVRSYDGAPDRLILMAASPTVENVKSVTSLSFDRATRKLSISTYEGAICSLKNADGAVVESATKGSELIQFDCSALKGKHALEVQFEEVTPFTIQLVF